MIIKDDDSKEATEEDSLNNCWKAPPRSVYSATDTTSIHTSMLSDPSAPYPTTPDAQKNDHDYADLLQCTEALEEATHKHAKYKAAAKEVEMQIEVVEKVKDTKMQHLREQMQAITETLILEKFHRLIQRTEQIKDQNKELDDWKSTFDADQKKCFQDSEKIAKKLDSQAQTFDAKLQDLSISLEGELQAHQEHLMSIFQWNETQMNQCLNSLMTMVSTLADSTKNAQNHATALRVFTKQHNKRQKHGFYKKENDEDMTETDALCADSGALAPDIYDQGKVRCPHGDVMLVLAI
eukprot:15330108-Ditylum_brightwellii.AAC.1